MNLLSILLTLDLFDLLGHRAAKRRDQETARQKRLVELEAEGRAMQEARKQRHPGVQGVSYEIVVGDDLKAGDTIIDRGQRFLIDECGPGVGAFIQDYGQYVWIKGYYIGYGPATLRDFWLFQSSPIVKVIPSTS